MILISPFVTLIIRSFAAPPPVPPSWLISLLPTCRGSCSADTERENCPAWNQNWFSRYPSSRLSDNICRILADQYHVRFYFPGQYGRAEFHGCTVSGRSRGFSGKGCQKLSVSENLTSAHGTIPETACQKSSSPFSHQNPVRTVPPPRGSPNACSIPSCCLRRWRRKSCMRYGKGV